MFEGGHRVPFIVHWPKQLKGNQTYEGLTSSLDIFKTAIAASNIKEEQKWHLDGVDLLPYLKDEKQTEPHDKLYWRKLNNAAVRIGDNKLVRLENYGNVLYNLKSDIGESQDLSKTENQTLESLTQQLKDWEKEYSANFWNSAIDSSYFFSL